ncbi:S9 family peptidase [Blastococcus xanthinilyticus]|uniref:Dipeptidyl aminopeptidase/acylaminoacyl peptidase n=1 Tax=Blastococcus xanthinilyticus TaxID=1564164 RepID=A0A5S5CR35_9ACTN|nr:prolyl oligopeptidase family serine peptidase [Blastococcus xanthinilyticus]TYP86153.1 dipeptidyl aminopeptidase/acylaminoacyl peptidase [Blastococcus xanthinilyticus]
MAGPLTDPWTAAPAGFPALESLAPPEALPAEVHAAVARIAGATALWCPAPSPDGRRIAYVTDRSGLPRLEVAALDGRSRPVQVSGADQEVISVAWSPDGAWLAYLVSPGGSICAELHVVRPDGTGGRLLAGADPRAAVFAGCWAGPGHYACSIADGAGPDADVVLVDVVTGERRTLASGGFLLVTAVSADHRTVLARRGPRAYRHVVVIDVPTGVQRRVLPLDAPGGIASEDGRFSADGGTVFVRAALPGPPGADRAGLVAVPVDGDGGRGRTVLSRPDADLDGYVVRPDGTVLALWNNSGISQLWLHALSDGSVVRRIPLPQAVLSGWAPASDGDALVAELSGPRAPRALWRVPLDGAGDPEPLACSPAPPDPRGLVRPVRHEYVAPDGVRLSGWLYVPEGSRGPNRTVVSFHGGPEGQARPNWSPITQSMVAAGLTVFAPNVRGSGGFGRAFMTADDGPARESSFADVRTTVDELVTAGIAAPGQVGAHGWSYGGYLTLVALTRWPELFAAGTSLAGMSDLRTFFAGTEPWMAAASVTEYGDPVADRELLAAISPMTALHRLSAPVLLVHGDRDTNVPVAESVQAHQALQARGARADLLLFPGEGHAIVGRPNLVELGVRLAAWFDRWL